MMLGGFSDLTWCVIVSEHLHLFIKKRGNDTCASLLIDCYEGKGKLKP